MALLLIIAALLIILSSWRDPPPENGPYQPWRNWPEADDPDDEDWF